MEAGAVNRADGKELVLDERFPPGAALLACPYSPGVPA